MSHIEQLKAFNILPLPIYGEIALCLTAERFEDNDTIMSATSYLYSERELKRAGINFRQYYPRFWLSTPPETWDYLDFMASGNIETHESFDMLIYEVNREIYEVDTKVHKALQVLPTKDVINYALKELDKCINLNKLRRIYNDYRLYADNGLMDEYPVFDDIMKTEIIKFYAPPEKIRINPVSKKVDHLELVLTSSSSSSIDEELYHLLI